MNTEEIKQEARRIIANFEAEAIKTDKNGSVLVRDNNSGMEFWFDVWVDTKYKDIDCDWNQDTFFLLNEDDLLRREIQHDCNVFDIVSSEATCFLENKGVIRQDNNGNWFNN